MSLETFKIVFSHLRPHIERQVHVTRFCEPISVEVRVAATIWRLSTNTKYQTTAALFGLLHSTVSEIVLETCNRKAQHLMPLDTCISVPRGEGLQEIVDGFKNCLGSLQGFGAIDGTYMYVPII